MVAYLNDSTGSLSMATIVEQKLSANTVQISSSQRRQGVCTSIGGHLEPVTLSRPALTAVIVLQ